MAKKPTVYVDTNIISMLCYPGGWIRDVARQLATRDWWENERQHFELKTSWQVEDELRDGVFKGQDDAISMVRRIRFLQSTAAVYAASRELLYKRIVPSDQGPDSIHLAFTLIYEIDYLLTWNQSHLANPQTQQKLETLCSKNRWRAPLLVSPDSIPSVRLAKEIRRR
ncbi:MAG TPA: hypothetical protein VEK08_05295 [Planctomycetota bacterium]|nr:hypothetical protein [Planctomycetota bacterium]